MNFRQVYFLVILLAAMGRVGYGQDNNGPLKLSLQQAQEFALDNNRNVQAAKIDVEIMAKTVKEALAIGMPQLNVAGNYQHQFVVPEISFGAFLDPSALPAGTLTKDDIVGAYKQSPLIPLGVKDNTTFDFTVSQLIFSGEYLIGLHASKVVKQMTDKSLIKTQDMTKETVASSYFMVLVLEESSRVLKESLKTIGKTYNDIQKMNEQGFNEDTDVDQIKISKSNLERLIASIEAQRDISLKLLKFQLGVDFGRQVDLTDSIPGLINTGKAQYLTSPDYNVSKSIDYQIMSDQVYVSNLQLKRAQATWLPVISGFYRHHEQTNQPSFNFAVKDLVGLTLSFPIFTSGQRTAKISQARFNLDKANISRANAEQGLLLDFESALSSYQTAFNNFITNSESIILSRKIYDKSMVKFQEGVSTSFELSQNQSQYLTSESNYYNSVLTLLNAKAKLDRILSIY
jgi:outer membrane protein